MQDTLKPPTLRTLSLVPYDGRSSSMENQERGPAKAAFNHDMQPMGGTRGSLGRACKVEDYSDIFNDGPKKDRTSKPVSQKRSKMSYEDMVTEAVFNIADIARERPSTTCVSM